MRDEPQESEHWRLLARRAGMMAAEIRDLDARMRMLQVALGYEQLAQEAKKRERERPA